ncbi:MAG: hypothetical protein E7277_00430 [Lachnospiraceae bacterium]|nr:hypothetical protein [Lachnospiraceae bacterium]
MEVRSKKELYKDEVEGKMRFGDEDFFLWDEDLWDLQLVVYPKDFSFEKVFGVRQSDFERGKLIFQSEREGRLICMENVKWFEKEECVLIQENVFNNIWKYVKNGVALGIQIAKDSGEDVWCEEPEDILDLGFLDRRGSRAVVENDCIVRKARTQLNENKQAWGRMQSALANPHNHFFYSEMEQVYHDKECELIHEIPAEAFQATEKRPEDREMCCLCARKSYIRQMCHPYVKQIGRVDYMLKSRNLRTDDLERMALSYGLKLRMEDTNTLWVKGAEDTWLIKGFEEAQLSLWHNNYVRLSPKERYITSGYHNQGMDGRGLYAMLEVIRKYTFAKHLAAEERAIDEQIAGIMEDVAATVRVIVKEIEKQREKEWRQFVYQLRRTVFKLLFYDHIG